MSAYAYPPRPRSRFARMLRAITSPQYRYHNAKIIHAVRVGFAMLTSILISASIDMPGQTSIWTSVTTMVVICGLQHHGNIRKKAFDRGIGTLLGSLIGLMLIVIHMTTSSMTLIYLLMSVVAGVCGYYAIGKVGYIALLTAITMCIVAGFGNNELTAGLWRTGAVVIGIVIALAFSFALPLYATYSWRYGLASDLRTCAQLYVRVVNGEYIDNLTFAKRFASLSQQSAMVRSLMPSVAKEIGMPIARLEQIQWLHRSLLSSLEMLYEGLGQARQQAIRQAFARHDKEAVSTVRTMLLSTARALRCGGNMHALGEDDNRDAALTNHDAADVFRDNAIDTVDIESSGPHWLAQHVAAQVTQLHKLLCETQPYWNIEGKRSAKR